MTLDAAAAVARMAGVVTHVSALPVDPPGTNLFLRVAHVGRGLHPDAVHAPLDGAAISTDADDAELRAVMEGLEHYAAAAWRAPDFVWSSAEELGEDAVPVEELPRAQPLDARDRIRWVEGWELADGRPVWIPAVMAYIGLPPAVEAEAFWPQISTGCAAHADLGAAVMAGLLECVERDAIATTWILERRVPRLADVDDALAPVADAALDVALYDATTDLGIPVVLAVVRGAGDVATVLAGAARADPASAAARAVAEAVHARTMLPMVPAAPDDPAQLRRPTDAARWLGRPGCDEPWAALDNGESVKLDELAAVDLSKPALMARLASCGVRAYAVDLTCDELVDVGAAAVRVVVPALQPISLRPGVTFDDHPRLARAAVALGLDPAARNPFPVPFA